MRERREWKITRVEIKAALLYISIHKGIFFYAQLSVTYVGTKVTKPLPLLCHTQSVMNTSEHLGYGPHGTHSPLNL